MNRKTFSTFRNTTKIAQKIKNSLKKIFNKKETND
jgi:hypothetical protein